MDSKSPTAIYLNLSSTDTSLLTDHLPSLRRLARRLIDDEDVAEDVLGEAVSRARAAAVQVHDLRRYAAGVVRRLALRQSRAEGRRRHHEAARAAERSPLTPAADTIAERVELMGATLDEIGRLPAAQSRAIGLRYVDGVPVRDIAAMEGCTASTVRTHLSRGLATVRERLDARFGGRATWSSVLAPWALEGAPTALSSAGGSRATAATKVAAGTSSGAVGAALLTMTSLKALLLFAAPLAVLAAWFVRSDAGSAPRASSTDVVASADAEPSRGVASDPAPAIRGPVPTREREPLAVAQGVQAAQAPSVPQRLPVEGVVIDARGGDPQPGIRVEIAPLDGEAFPQLASAVTDAEGRFTAPNRRLARGSVRVKLQDEHSGRLLMTLDSVPFPFETELVLEAHAALYFDYGGQAVVPVDAPCRVQSPGREYNATMRGGPLPWTRFREPLPSALKSLEVLAPDGFHFGRVALESGRGHRAAPLRVEFQPGGRVEFTADSDLLSIENALRLQSTDADDAPPIYLSFRAQPETGTPRAVVEHLVPGRYEWEHRLGDAVETGAFVVRPRETTQVDVQSVERGGTGLAVLIDASAAPEAEVDRWSFSVFDEAHVTQSLRATVERSGAPEAGLWTARVEGLPPGDWRLVIGGVKGYTLSEQLVRLEMGRVVGPVVVTRAAENAQVHVRVVDAETDELIPGARLWVLTGLEGHPSDTLATGESPALGLSGSAPSSLFAAADGYGLGQLDFIPGVTEPEVTLRLHAGWRSRVLVFNMADPGFAEGVTVHVDGELLGRTGEDGALWLDLDGAPERVEVAKGQPEFEVLMDPFAQGTASETDTPGYVFIVRGS